MSNLVRCPGNTHCHMFLMSEVPGGSPAAAPAAEPQPAAPATEPKPAAPATEEKNPFADMAPPSAPADADCAQAFHGTFKGFATGAKQVG